MDLARQRLVSRLAAYSDYHRDTRNRRLHRFGIPLIVFSALLALSVVPFPPAASGVSAAMVAALGLVLYYVRLDPVLAIATAAALILMIVLASMMSAHLATDMVLGIAGALFVTGWILQLAGHLYEGRRPALVDDLALMFVAPLYLAAEAAFGLGWRPDLQQEIQRRLGPGAGSTA